VELRPVGDEIFQLALMPRAGVNAYLVGDVLVDAGLSVHAGRIVKALLGRQVGTHALTHAHGDHAGGSKKVSDTLGIPVWVGAGDAEALRAGKAVAASRVQAMFGWKPVAVARELREGDEVGPGFTVLDTPGHSPGHISLWRESDRTLICGDVFVNLNLLTLAEGLHEPPRAFTVDPARNRESARRLAALEPQLVLFGHGHPLRDAAKLKAFAQSLPAG
jgi:glyoxylase-like metal-dependent hydrolase (beta-lactamase superfamily II)